MLYLVATPIGNLKDITLRAIEVLKEVDFIACEDTRHSLVLLNHYDIKKPLISYHKFNEEKESEKLIEKLKEGKNIALISDAGLPVISDPGNILIKKVKEANLEYTVIPGASAGITALILSGIDADKFCFLGFLPQKNKERKEFLEKYVSLDVSLIFYSAPHDLKKDLISIKEFLGNRKTVAVKEITKINEKIIDVDSENLDSFENQKGEFVIIVEKGKNENKLNNLSEMEHFQYYLNKGLDKKEAIKCVAKDRNVSKSSLYKYTIE